MLKNYREVGKFDVLEAPRNPIGAFASEQFKNEALELVEKGTKHLVVNLGDLDFLYSDALNAFSTVHQKLSDNGGSLGVLAIDELAVKSIEQARLDSIIKIYRNEAEMLTALVRGVVTETSKEKSKTEKEEKVKSRVFTQSFNSISVDDNVKGVREPFNVDALESSSSVSSLLIVGLVLVFIVVVAALVWHFLM